MSHRGKDDGFNPHPGDPWHPGWSSEEEPVAQAALPAAEEELEAPPDLAPASETGPVAAAAERAAAEAEEVTAAGEPPAGEVAEWAEALGVPPEEPAALPVAGEGGREGAAETLFGWAEGRLPLGQAPAESAAEPEHLPPPWAPEEAEAVGPLVIPAAEPAAQVELAKGWAPEGGQSVAGVEEGEVEVDEWLAFAAEPPPTVEEAARIEEARPVAAPRRRLWPFGRRARRAEERPGESPEEAWAQAEEAGEAPGPKPPPWSPEGVEEAPVGPGLRPAGEAEGTPVGEEAWEVGEEAWEVAEGWEQPAAEAEPVAPAAEAWESGEEEPPPPPWVSQAELDRAAPIPVIPAALPGEEPEGEPAEAEWAQEAGAHPDAWFAAEARAGETVPIVPPEEGEAEEWEVFPEPGRPMGAAGPPSVAEAPPGEWGQPAGHGFEAAGAPTVEMPPPEESDYLRHPPPRELISEEMFAGAVTTEHRDLAEEVAAADTSEAQLQALSAPMAGLESGVVGFEDVVHLGGEEEFVESARSDLPVRVATGMVLVGILLGAMWVGGEFLAGFVGLLAILGLGELYGTLRRAGYQPLALFGFLGAIGLLAGTWFYGLVAIPIAAVATTVVSFFYYTLASRRRDPLTNGSLTVLGMLWIAGTLAFAFPIAAAPHFERLILALAATVIATDVGAFFAGRSWGSRPLAPVLSPNKTVEGLAGGVVLGIGVAVAIGYFLEPLNIRTGAGLGLVVAVMAPLGDLAESMLKRSLGVKDMGSILPGHGGILDRLDAFLFVLPAAWVLYETLGLLR